METKIYIFLFFFCAVQVIKVLGLNVCLIVQWDQRTLLVRSDAGKAADDELGLLQHNIFCTPTYTHAAFRAIMASSSTRKSKLSEHFDYVDAQQHFCDMLLTALDKKCVYLDWSGKSKTFTPVGSLCTRPNFAGRRKVSGAEGQSPQSCGASGCAYSIVLVCSPVLFSISMHMHGNH
jgi:hypothetical protein